MDKRTEKHITSGEIFRLYNEGTGLEVIAKTIKASQKTVKKVLLHFGIDYDAERVLEYSNKLEQVLLLYAEGKPQIYIEKELGLTRKTIRTLLKGKDLQYRSKSEQWHLRYGTEIDHSCLDVLTSEALYWIGMLYADGHIAKSEKSISLTLKNSDIDHLKKLKEFLKTNRDIKRGSKDCHKITVNSEKIHSRLHDLGFTHRKSWEAIPHELLKNSRDFWRGCVDGDGGVYNYSNPQMTLCGTLETIFEFIIFCTKETAIKSKYPSASGTKKLYQVHYYGEDCRKVLDLLYKDATVYLDRKYQTYLEICSENTELIKN